tara:strand:- start:729 stop:923 length:195 start_codon:yes stop_codon:yes gene_type:complete
MKTLKQSEALRKVLRWMDDCPFEVMISSMTTGSVHLKIPDTEQERRKYEKEPKSTSGNIRRKTF